MGTERTEHWNKRSGVHRHGSAIQEAEQSGTYPASGEGEWSRKSAHGQPYKERRDDGPPMPAAETLAKQTRELQKLYAKLRASAPTMSAAQIGKIQRGIEIKTATIQRLRGELPTGIERASSGEARHG